jgi:hypothetical protein
LRKKEKTKRASAIESFRTGVFGGIAALLTIAAIYYYFMEYPNPHYQVKKDPPGYSTTTFFLYRLILLPIIMGMLFSLDVLIWKAKRINYVFIFQFNPRDHLYPWQLVELFFVLYDVTMVSLLAYMWTVVMEDRGIINFKGYAYIHPFILLGLLALWMFNPLKFIFGKARWWIIKILVRIVCAPFVQVKFADFYIADQLTSLSSVLFELQFIMCVYPTLSSNNMAKFCDKVQGLGIPVLSIAPAYWRFMQCIRRFIDSKQWNPHLLNAGKYAASILVAIFSFVDRGFFTTQSAANSWNAFRILFLVTAVISTAYSLVWDIWFDWGLFRPGHKLLRKEIVFNPIVYYIAIVVNTALRLFWIVVFLLKYYLSAYLTDPWIPFAFVFVELIRRGMWNVFRLENEHLNNCGQFRAVTDVPLPFEVELPEKPVAALEAEDADSLWRKPFRFLSKSVPTTMRKYIKKWKSCFAMFEEDEVSEQESADDENSAQSQVSQVSRTVSPKSRPPGPRRVGSIALDMQINNLRRFDSTSSLSMVSSTCNTPRVVITPKDGLGRSNSTITPYIQKSPHLQHLRISRYYNNSNNNSTNTRMSTSSVAREDIQSRSCSSPRVQSISSPHTRDTIEMTETNIHDYNQDN